MRKVIFRISGIASVLFYIILVYQVWHLCRFGGIRSHLPAMAGAGVLFVITAVLYLIMGQHIRKGESRRHKKDWGIRIALAAAAAVTVYFGAATVYSVATYNSALAWKLEEWKHQAKVELVHDNFFESGAEGVMEDLDRALDLPEELYIVNQFQMRFDGDGTIRTIYAFLYGKDAGGNTRTYLIDYNAAGGEDITVTKNGWADTDYNADMKLAPLLTILGKASCETQVSEWEKEKSGRSYEILYMGRRSFTTDDGLRYFAGDADGDGKDDSTFYPGTPLAGGEVVGYEVSLHIPAEEEITPVRYIMETGYISAAQLAQEHNEQQSEAAKESELWTVDSSDGSMRFFLNDRLGWRLEVVNAALGSRAYSLERTQDGGATWETANEDPFAGNLGVAEGLRFFDADFGFAAISSASQTDSWVYVTQDGGSTFTQITLPMTEVTQLPEHADDYGNLLEDYKYLCMPQKDGDTFTIDVLTGAGEDEGLRFRSGDNGITWTFDGIF